MPNGQRHLAATITSGGPPSSLEALRRNYVILSDAERAGAREPSPREIVAALHKRIAAKSPRHAALVAEFERMRAEKAAAP